MVVVQLCSWYIVVSWDGDEGWVSGWGGWCVGGVYEYGVDVRLCSPFIQHGTFTFTQR